MISQDNRYTQMQLKQYNHEASQWSETNRNWVVGSFDGHNHWQDYENLFQRFTNESEMIGLDFGCGPGRNLVRYNNRFKRLDGVDISPVNIEKAREYTSHNNVETNLYINNGVDLQIIDSATYDFVMSVIVFQHIAVHKIRYGLMSEIHRVLKPGGIFTAQMGYGPVSPGKPSVEYYENFFEAEVTNGHCDTRVESPSQLENDLIQIGFKEFQYSIGEVGPGDAHPNWIYFSAIK